MKRTPLARKTPMKRGKPPIRNRTTKSRPKRSPNEFPDESKKAMRARSGGRCEVRSKVCTGRGEQFHHRQSRRFKDQRPVNGLHSCNKCHDHIHAKDGSGRISKSKLMGWIVSQWQDPADVPIIRGDGGR